MTPASYVKGIEMTTIYAVYDRYGLVGRCDARCHEAKKPECHCICGGARHGVGSRVTQEEVNAVSDDELIENAIKRGIIGPPRVQRHEEQLNLFESKAS